MGKSKKHGIEVPAPSNIVSGEGKKKGKRGLEEAVEMKSLKKQKVAATLGKEKRPFVKKDTSESEEDKVSKLPPNMKGFQNAKPPSERVHAKQRSKGVFDKPKIKELKMDAKPVAKLSARMASRDESTSEESSEDESDKKHKIKKQKVEPAGKVINASLKPSAKELESSDEDSDEDESSDELAKNKLKAELKKKEVKQPVLKYSGKMEESSSDESSEEESDEEPTILKQKVIVPNTKEVKNLGKASLKPSTKKVESSDEDSSEDESEEEPKIKEVKNVGKPVLKPFAKKMEINKESSSEESSEDESEEEIKVVKQKVEVVKSILQKPKTKVPDVKALVEEEDSSDESDESDSEEGPLPKPKQLKENLQKTGTLAVKAPAKEEESSDDSDESAESDSDEEPIPNAKKIKPSLQKVQAPVGKPLSKEESSDDSDDSEMSDSEEEAMKQTKKLKLSLQKAKSPAVKTPAKEEDSSDETDESDEEEPMQQTKQTTGKGSTNGITGNGEDDDDDDDEDEDEEEDKTKKEKVKENGKVKKSNQVGPTGGGGSKTVFVKNLAWSVDENSVQEYFSDAGEIQEVRLAMGSDGRFRGFGHIEFTSAEGAMKACKKSGEEFAGREIFVDVAQERVFSPSSGGNKDWKSPTGGGFSGGGNQRSSSDSTAFVKGFDKYQDEDNIRSSLTEFFGECGVQNIRIPTDRETGDIKGFAYVDFKDKQALVKAVEYNGSDLNGHYLMIEEAGGGGGGGRGRGGEYGGRGGRDFGGRGGRGGRGRGDFGDRGRGGRGGGRGGRGFGTPKPKINLSGTGKKTTFGED